MKQQTIRQLVVTTFLTILVFSPVMLITSRAQTAPGGFPDLVSGLKATPGCLGVETARTGSGKQVIFAWFEDNTAALAWYYSEMHQATMRGALPGVAAHVPLADVPDDGTPIMAVASLTMAPEGSNARMPFSQIAIELYRPLPGGVALGGRFAPGTLKVPGLRDLSPSAPVAGSK